MIVISIILSIALILLNICFHVMIKVISALVKKAGIEPISAKLDRIDKQIDEEHNDYTNEDRKRKSKLASVIRGTSTGVGNTTKVVKKTSKGVKVATKVSIKALKHLIRLLKLLIHVIRIAISAIISMVSTGMIIVVVVLFIVVSILGGAYLLIINNNTTSNAGQGLVAGGFQGYDYSQIDWSQDFSIKLDEIESTYGTLERNWVELVIVNMRTSQENKDIATDLDGFMLGFKVIESGAQNIMGSSGSSEPTGSHPSTDLTSLFSSGSGAQDDGPYQVESGRENVWVKYNKSYTADRNSAGSKYFYPDLMLGIPSYFKVGGKEAFPLENPQPQIQKAFELAGVDMTSEKYYIILNCLYTMIYADGNLNAISPVSGISNEDCEVRNVNISLYLVLLMENYGWERNETKVKLASNMNTSSSNGAWKGTGVAPFDDLMRPISGMSGQGNGFSSNANSSSNLGIITSDGSNYSGTLYGYLRSIAPSQAQQYIDSSSSMDTIANTGQYKRIIYPMSVYLNSGLILDRAVSMLGLRDQVTTGSNSVQGSKSIVDIAMREGKAQPPNRITYGRSPQAYKADCSEFVARVLAEAGIPVFGLPNGNSNGFVAHDKFPLINSIEGSATETQKAWLVKNQAKSIIYNGKEGGITFDMLQPGDMLYRVYSKSGYGEHTAIYMGENSKGQKYICQASSSSGTYCSDDPENLEKGGYGFGFMEVSDNWLSDFMFVFRPSLVK